MKLSKLFLMFAFCLFAILNASAQTDSPLLGQEVQVKMKNGDDYNGTLLQQDEQSITLKTVNGSVNLIAANIKSIEQSTYTGKYLFPNAHDTRYFFAPSAIPIDKGKGYYQNLLVTTNFVNYGITKNVSIGGGFEFISMILDEVPPIWFFTPKAGFQVAEKIHVGGGLLLVGVGLESISTLAYGAGTFGTSESNVTVGLGYGFLDGEAAEAPVFLLSGTHRVSNGISLLTENYLLSNTFTDAFYLGIHGVRFLSKKNAFDLGVIVSNSFDGFIPALPYVGYARSF